MVVTTNVYLYFFSTDILLLKGQSFFEMLPIHIKHACYTSALDCRA